MQKAKILNKIYAFVKEESKNHGDAFENHVLEVRDYAVKLAKHYKADFFVVQAAAYLHDFYRFRDDPDDTHEIKGAEFAIGYLKELGVDAKTTELISKCIRHHRGARVSERLSVEEKIIACADAMDHISDSLDMFLRLAMKTPPLWGKNKPHDSAGVKAWLRAKLQRGWNKMELPYARELVKDKYEAMMLLLSEKKK
jgi:HD superfamily phosphodiesterase